MMNMTFIQDKNMKVRLKRKNSIYYIRWISDDYDCIITDLKDEALIFSFFKALKLRKELFGEWGIERVKV